MKYFKVFDNNRVHYTIRDTYLHYKDLANKGEVCKVSMEDYISICCEYFMYIVECVMRKGITYRLPHGTGNFAILKTRQKFGGKQKRSVDFKTTKELGKTVYHMNEHTNGYKYTWLWYNDYKVIRDKFMYRFIPSRYNKRLLAKLLIEHKVDFPEMSNASSKYTN